MALMRMLAFSPDSGTAQRASNGAPSSAPRGRPAALQSVKTPAEPSKQGPVEIKRSGVAADADWPTLVRNLKVAGAAKQLAERSELLSRQGDKFLLCVGADSRALVQPMYVDKLRAALQEVVGHAVKLDIQVGETSGASVAAIAENDKRARHDQANQQMNNDPFVRELMNSLDATIESVQPIQQGPQS